LEGCNCDSTSDRSAGPILAAQPQVRDNPINVFFFIKNMSYPIQVLKSINCHSGETDCVEIDKTTLTAFLSFRARPGIQFFCQIVMQLDAGSGLLST
jgi:hypothetical protein